MCINLVFIFEDDLFFQDMRRISDMIGTLNSLLKGICVILEPPQQQMLFVVCYFEGWTWREYSAEKSLSLSLSSSLL